MRKPDLEAAYGGSLIRSFMGGDNMSGFRLQLKLSDKDLDSVIQEASPEFSEKEKLKQLIREGLISEKLIWQTKGSSAGLMEHRLCFIVN